MNIITKITSRIEEHRKENKNPCKNYATEAAAEKATAKVAEMVAEHHGVTDADYLVFYIPAWGRWVGAINLTGVLNRHGAQGGYLGIASDKGFYTF